MVKTKFQGKRLLYLNCPQRKEESELKLERAHKDAKMESLKDTILQDNNLVIAKK